MRAKSLFSVFMLACIAYSGLPAQGVEVQISRVTPLSIGETIELESSILREKRLLNIYLPHGYSRDPSKTYPVIYLLDGSIDEDFLHISGLVQFGSFSWINMLPESIVVGIANVDRERDFTYPTSNAKDKADFPTTGGSALFVEFMEKEVKPLIGRNFKTAGPGTLIGQSLGGLLAAEVLLRKPSLFDNYIIVSPSLWWDDESLLQYEAAGDLSGKSIYIAVGKEGPIMERVARQLYAKMGQIKKESTRLYFNFFEARDHGDVLHLAVYDAFEKLFN